jgi:hypothetical protein
LRWTSVLDSDDPRNRHLRGVLPDYLFDDYLGVDWFVVWDNGDEMPKKLTCGLPTRLGVPLHGAALLA